MKQGRSVSPGGSRSRRDSAAAELSRAGEGGLSLARLIDSRRRVGASVARTDTDDRGAWVGAHLVTKGATVEAVRGVDFSVAAGEIVAFLGPNGTGKTSTQRMLSTLLTSTAGNATVAGCDLRRDPVGVRQRIGYVPCNAGAGRAGPRRSPWLRRSPAD